MTRTYIGTYTKTEANVEGKAEGIYIADFDADSGALRLGGEPTSAVNPSYLAVNPILKSQGYDVPPPYLATSLGKRDGGQQDLLTLDISTCPGSTLWMRRMPTKRRT